MRNTKRGSWFVQELNAALRLHARDKHLADILVQVKNDALHLVEKVFFSLLAVLFSSDNAH